MTVSVQPKRYQSFKYVFTGERPKQFKKLEQVLKSSGERFGYEADMWDLLASILGKSRGMDYKQGHLMSEEERDTARDTLTAIEREWQQNRADQVHWVLEESGKYRDSTMKVTDRLADCLLFEAKESDGQRSRLALSGLVTALGPTCGISRGGTNIEKTGGAESVTEAIRKMVNVVQGLGVADDDKVNRAIMTYRSALMEGGLSMECLEKELHSLEGMACFAQVCVREMSDALRNSARLCALLPEELESVAEVASTQAGSESYGSWSKAKTIRESLVDYVCTSKTVASLLVEQVKIDLAVDLFRIAYAHTPSSSVVSSDDETMTEVDISESESESSGYEGF